MNNRRLTRDGLRSVVRLPFHRPMVLIGVLFFVIGFITWTGSVLIPHLKQTCELTHFQSMGVAFSFYISYTVLALPSVFILRRTGYKQGIALALGVMSAGALLFIPAALYRSFLLFLMGVFVQGAGLALLQTAVNPYVTILGPARSAARRIAIMGLCSGVAAISAPLIGGMVLLGDSSSLTDRLSVAGEVERIHILTELSNRITPPYVIIASVLAAFAVAVLRSRLPEVKKDPEASRKEGAAPGPARLRNCPHLWLGALTLFGYVGAEVITGDTIISYALAQGVDPGQARWYASFPQLLMLVGYGVGIFSIPRLITDRRALLYSGVLGLLLTCAVLCTKGLPSVAAVAMLGLANAMVWPSIWPLALRDLGGHTTRASAVLVSAIGGGAVLPLLYGWIGDSTGLHFGYALLMPLYGLIVFYAQRGCLLSPLSSLKNSKQIFHDTDCR